MTYLNSNIMEILSELTVLKNLIKKTSNVSMLLNFKGLPTKDQSTL